MNKHTPQEWADWTGCYIAQDEDGDWFLYRDKPSRALHKQYWGSFNGFYICIPKDFIDVPADHKWTTLYEPRKSDNAPHQSEVFINQEYLVLQEDSLTDISSAVSLMISKGYRPAGGVAYSDGCFYQAMRRGI